MPPRELRVDNNIRLFRLQLISILIFFSLRIVSYIAVGTLTSLEGVCTGYTMLVDSQDPPVIRVRQPRNMDYVKISGVLIRPTVHLTVVARLASCLSLFAVIFTNSIRGKFQDSPALGQPDIPPKYSVVVGLVGYWSIVSAALTTNVVEVPSKLQTFTKFHISTGPNHVGIVDTGMDLVMSPPMQLSTQPKNVTRPLELP
ncbi:hypothetical protein SeLEV6574_g08512, partial [Synchytrium endobioticum]